ncbi:putative Methyltransferase domain-containing protein [uncultured Gammaproteobacteria bacterium]
MSATAFEYARSLHRAERLAEAAAGYRAILATWPGHVECLHLLGVVAYQQGKHEEAEALIGQALVIDPNNARAHYNLGNVLWVVERLREAAVAHVRALEIDPTLSEAVSALATLVPALLNQGHATEAVLALRQALAAGGDSPELLYNLGVAFQAKGDQAEAAACYRKVLAVEPDLIEAEINLGAALQALGEGEAALNHFRRALGLDGERVEARLALGATLHGLGRPADAETEARRVLVRHPDHPQALYNLGSALLAQDRHQEAGIHLRRSVTLDATNPDAWNNLGLAREALGRHAEAATCYRRGLELRPGDVGLSLNLAGAAYRLHLVNPEATQGLAEYWLAAHPDDPVARHAVAALTGRDPPPRCSDAYLGRLFDHFSPRFDEQLAATGYCGPALIEALLRRSLPPPGRTLAVLDAGCGTGLCASILRPYARTLDGVDLSPQMLEKAKQLSLYDTLTVAEITAYLQSRPEAFDLIAAGDVLCYLGDLEPLIVALAAALRPGGWTAVTVQVFGEDAVAPDVHLEAHGRYRHAPRYPRRLLAAHGLTVVAEERATLRWELGQADPGQVLLAIREP